MAKPIWTGAISFGLLNIPVQLMPAEKRVDLHFRMLDHRDNARIRYERVNADTGEEVPWKEVVKAFEYDKGSYIVVDRKDLKAASPDSAESVDIQAFIDLAEVTPRHLEKPYFLVPMKKAEKGYALLRETLRKLKKVGLARVVIRTREYLSLVMPEGDALILILIRYPQELLPLDSYTFPKRAAQRISAKELDMAEQLVTSMSDKWTPKSYRDEFREKLTRTIEARIRKKKGVKAPKTEEQSVDAEETSGKVVDFMALLQKSIATQKRTPAKSRPQKAQARKAPAKKRARKASQ